MECRASHLLGRHWQELQEFVLFYVEVIVCISLLSKLVQRSICLVCKLQYALLGVGYIAWLCKLSSLSLSLEHGPPKRLTIMHMESGTKLTQYTLVTPREDDEGFIHNIDTRS